jgi:hypothetical protein
MSRRTRFIPSALAALVLVVLALPAAAAKSKGRSGDLITTAPNITSARLRSIALLPVATFDKNFRAENMVASYVGQNFKDTGHRWISAATTRDMIRSLLGDSVLTAVREGVLKSGRTDSLHAPLLCAKLRADAVLCVRVDQWEQAQVLWNQSGKPMTSIRLKAALVDSTGSLLWSVSGGETGEGPLHDPSTNPLSVSSSGLDNLPVTGQGGPPPYEEVLNKLLLRWASQFPRLVASEPAK